MTNQANKLPVFQTLGNAWGKIPGTKLTFWMVFLLAGVLIGINGFLKFYLKTVEAIPTTESINLLVLIGAFLAYIIFSFLFVLTTNGARYLGVLRARNEPIAFAKIKQAYDKWVVFRIIGLVFLIMLAYIPIILIFLLPNLFFYFTQPGSETIVTAATQNTAMVATQTSAALSSTGKLLTAIFYVVGIILFIFLTMRLYLSLYLVVVDKYGPWHAMQTSYRATRSNVFRILMIAVITLFVIWVNIVLIGVGFGLATYLGLGNFAWIGGVIGGLGLIWVLPWGCIIYGEMYKCLMGGVGN